MFGMSMTEILVILVIALLFLGPEKLPEAAKQISKGIRDLRKQTREFQDTIENDTQIGGAIRDIKSALRGDEIRRPPVRKQPEAAKAAAAATLAAAGDETAAAAATTTATAGEVAPSLAAELPVAPAADPLAAAAMAGDPLAQSGPAATVAAELPVAPAVDPLTDDDDVPPAAPEDPTADDGTADEAAELAAMIRPATGAVGRT